MIRLYQIILFLILAVAGPFLLLKKKSREGLKQKFGFIPESMRARILSSGAEKRIWFHAVSVGEFNALYPLLLLFREKHPEFLFFVSTTTATGQELARAKCSEFAEVFYFPFDFRFAIRSLMNLIRPQAVVIVETEIWPTFMAECKRRAIDVVLINGRLSPKSFKGYMRFAWFFKSTLLKFKALLVQSESEKLRFQSLVSDPNLPCEVCGNIKLDGLKACRPAESDELRRILNLKQGELVLVAGSTHEGEESALISALKEMNFAFRLILVPRHPERFERVVQLVENSALNARRYTKGQAFESKKDVYVLDTIGQLNKFYSIADLAFVGGTLAKIGGHNLSEPCVYRVPVICGPHIHKARDMYQKLSEYAALKSANDERELSKLIRVLFDSPAVRREMGENGYRYLSESQGALAKTMSLLEKYLDLESPDLKDRKVETVQGAGR